MTEPRGFNHPVEGPVEVVYRDARVAALNKPAGLVVIPGRHDGSLDTLTNRLWMALWQEQGLLPETRENCRPLLVHRLDKDTSGLVLFALNLDAQRDLHRQFETHRVVKTYLALVQGAPPQANGRVDAPVGERPSRRKGARGRMGVFGRNAREAVTDYRVLCRDDRYSLLMVTPRTGRTHQIRVHLSHVGCPLAIDPVYHPLAPGEPPADLPMDRLTLHALRVRFQSPPGGGWQEISAPLPDDFARTLDFLGFSSQVR